MSLAIRLPKEIENRLDRLAKETGRTKTFYGARSDPCSPRRYRGHLFSTFKGYKSLASIYFSGIGEET